jgi:hypothetical protein
LLFQGGTDVTPRNKVVREILSTEQSYFKSLGEICVSYRDQLNLVPGDLKKSIPVLFQNIDNIRSLSEHLLAALTDMINSWKSSSSSVSACFLSVGPFFVDYEQYCRGFEAAQKQLDVLSLDPAFLNFLKSAKAELPLSALIGMFVLVCF